MPLWEHGRYDYSDLSFEGLKHKIKIILRLCKHVVKKPVLFLTKNTVL